MSFQTKTVEVQICIKGDLNKEKKLREKKKRKKY